MPRVALLVACLLCIADQSFAQLPTATERVLPPFQSGGRLGYLMNFHHTNSEIFANCPECGNFHNGVGSGYVGEIFAEMPAKFYPALSFSLALGLAEKGGDFGQVTTSELPIQDPNSGAYVPLVRDHAFNASLMYGNIVAGLKYQPLEDIPAYVGGGIEVELPLGSQTKYKQTEAIRSPTGVLYPETGTTSRVVGEGVISDVATGYAARGTLGYRIPVDRQFDIAPEVSYSYALTDVEPHFDWRVGSLAIGAAIRWHFVPEVKDTSHPAPPPVLAMPTVVKKHSPEVQLAVRAGTPPLHIIETTVTETFPILPYIFFDSASPVLPARILRLTPDEADNFNEANLPHRSLESYYSLLNVIAARMRQNPSATLTINGTTDGIEIQPKQAARDLAKARAMRVRDYLVDAWHISPKRLIVTSSDAPANPSSTEYVEGYAENRRVELSSANDDLLKPIIHERFREETAQPKELPIAIAASGEPTKSWRLTLSAHGQSILERSGAGAPPSDFSWRPEDHDLEALARTLGPNDSIEVALDVTGANGTIATARTAMPASRSTNPFELSRLSLIVFDFDQASINEQNRRMISHFVQKSIYPASTVSIVGSTDNLGELKHNQKLSEDRAMNVRDLVLKEKSDAKITKTEGIGPSNLTYDNSLPEGRYYCRTVKVSVETPLEAILPRP